LKPLDQVRRGVLSARVAAVPIKHAKHVCVAEPAKLNARANAVVFHGITLSAHRITKVMGTVPVEVLNLRDLIPFLSVQRGCQIVKRDNLFEFLNESFLSLFIEFRRLDEYSRPRLSTSQSRIRLCRDFFVFVLQSSFLLLRLFPAWHFRNAKRG